MLQKGEEQAEMAKEGAGGVCVCVQVQVCAGFHVCSESTGVGEYV